MTEGNEPSIYDDALSLGIDVGYVDYKGTQRRAPESTVRSFVKVLGEDAENTSQPVETIRTGTSHPLAAPAELHTEDGATQALTDSIPQDVPLGYHRLVDRETGATTTLVVSPGRCHLPEGLKTWGWALQLYAVRSESSWGIGDLADLREVARWAGHQGAGVALLNPLHAANPLTPQQASPYYPSSRCTRNVLYLRIEEIEGSRDAGIDLESLAMPARALNSSRLIDRNAIFELKMEALRRLWALRGTRSPALAGAGHDAAVLEGQATFMALVEEHGTGPESWPAEHNHPDNPAVARWRAENSDRVKFHQWVQSLLDEQLARASNDVAMVHDLAIGVDPEGADAWLWQDVFAHGVSVGAPPDEFNNQGQSWGVLAFNPRALRAVGYEPFIQTVRSALKHAGGMRVDHVMGMWRLFWIPESGDPAHGTYVRYPSREMLDILALESHRAGAFVIGEDLGTVEAEVRAELLERDMLSYRVFWFEKNPTTEYPERALATLTNHDLPTVPGVWTGADLEAQRAAGLSPDAKAEAGLRRRLADHTGLPPEAPVADVVTRAYGLLGRAPSAILTATLDDALGVEERPNQPGTMDERPNWSLALPLPLEEIEAHPQPAAIAEALTRD